MKITRSIISLGCMFFYILLVNSCCRNCDESILEGNALEEGENTGNESSTLKSINIIEFPNLKLSDLTVISPIGDSKIDSKGIFESEYEEDETEALPVYFTKIEEKKVLFGYYPGLIKENKITALDILIFYLLTDVEIAIRGYADVKVIAFLEGSSKKSTLINLVKESLNQNIAPIDNNTFRELLASEVKAFIDKETSGELNKTAKFNYITSFKIEYDRDGGIGLPTASPIFTAMGIEIVNPDTGEYIINNHILKPKSLVLSPSSLIEYIMEHMLTGPNYPEYNEVMLKNTGRYEIHLTNGKSIDSISKKVKSYNKKYWIAAATSYGIPKGLKSYLKKSDCWTGIINLQANLAAKFDLYSEVPPTKEELQILVYSLIKEMSGLGLKCLSDSILTYLIITLEAHALRFNILEDLSELIFFTRDYFGSNIVQTESRLLVDGVSVGELKFSNISPTEFIGLEGEYFEFEGKVEEEVLSYVVDRGLKSTTFTPKVEMIEAEKIPFYGWMIEGNAKILSNSNFLSNSSGVFKLNGSIGSMDSEIGISSPVSRNLFGPVTTIKAINENIPKKLVYINGTELEPIIEVQNYQELYLKIVNKNDGRDLDINYRNISFDNISNSEIIFEKYLEQSGFAMNISSAIFNNTDYQRDVSVDVMNGPEKIQTLDITFIDSLANFRKIIPGIWVRKTYSKRTSSSDSYKLLKEERVSIASGDEDSWNLTTNRSMYWRLTTEDYNSSGSPIYNERYHLKITDTAGTDEWSALKTGHEGTITEDSLYWNYTYVTTVNEDSDNFNYSTTYFSETYKE